jgi:hypothetical protein
MEGSYYRRTQHVPNWVTFSRPLGLGP